MFICLRHDWFGSHRYRNLRQAAPRSAWHSVMKMKKNRANKGLFRPYGPAAYALGLASSPEIPKPPPPKQRGKP